jgi:hypothetical protein
MKDRQKAAVLGDRQGRWPVLCLLMAFCIVNAAPAHGDAPGALQYTTDTGTMKISIYTDPNPARVGKLEVIDLAEPVPPGARIPSPACQVVYYPAGTPKKRRTTPSSLISPMNKPVQLAQLELTEPGPWQVEVQMEVERDSRYYAPFQLTVEEASVGASFAYWVGLPSAAVLLFIALRRLVARRQYGTSPVPQGGS